MKLDSVRVIVPQRGRDRCALFDGRADRGSLVLPFVFLLDGLNVTPAGGRSPRPGLPPDAVTALF